MKYPRDSHQVGYACGVHMRGVSLRRCGEPKMSQKHLFPITILVMIFNRLASKSLVFLWHVSGFSYKAIPIKYFIVPLGNRSLPIPLWNRCEAV